MKKLIITEKANAARRISTILSDGKSHSSTSGGVTVISFESGGDDYDVVSLRGHIIELDYPKEYNDWSGTSPVDLVYAPQVKTVIMTGMSDVTFVRQAREAGVDSFIYKNVRTDDLLSVIRSTVEGYSTFPSSRKGDAPEVELLDELELKILYLTCQAKSRREIAAALYMSEGTVKRRISEMLAKTGYDNLLKLAVRAVSSGSIVVNVER